MVREDASDRACDAEMRRRHRSRIGSSVPGTVNYRSVMACPKREVRQSRDFEWFKATATQMYRGRHVIALRLDLRRASADRRPGVVSEHRRAVLPRRDA